MSEIVSIEEVEYGEEYVYDIINNEENYVCGSNKVTVKQSDTFYNKYAAKADVKYGDSVTPDTPIMVREEGKIKFIEIGHLHQSPWIPYNNFKPGEPERKDKQQSSCSREVWDGTKWTHIRRVIRHRVGKRLYEVFSGNGCVTVTEDHSLIDSSMKYLKPKDLKCGTMLFNGYPVNTNTVSPSFHMDPVSRSEQIAFMSGILFACNRSTIDRNLNITCCHPRLMTQCLELLSSLNPETFFVFVDGSCIQTRSKREDSSHFKINDVPESVFRNPELYPYFLGAMYRALGVFQHRSKLVCSKLYYMLRTVGIQTSISLLNSVYVLSYQPVQDGKVSRVSSLYITGEYDFVYDLETESGRFQAGIGASIVKNTDSIYTLFKFPNHKNIEKDVLLDMCWDTASECCERISNTFIRPVELEMEKIMWPLYLYGKKRYSCKIYEKTYDDQGKSFYKSHKDFKGIQVVRRDNCKLVKTISNPVFECLLDHNDINAAVNVVHEYVEKLFRGELKIDEFVVSKSLKSHYKTTNVAGKSMALPGHVLLAEKMRERKVMNPPQTGDRVQYVYVETDDPKAIGRDKMEDPNYVLENPDVCKIDDMFYLEKQISSPLYTIFEVLVKNENGTMYPRKVANDGKTSISNECKRAINELLFKSIVEKLYNRPNFITKKPRIQKPKTQKNDMLSYLLSK